MSTLETLNQQYQRSIDARSYLAFGVARAMAHAKNCDAMIYFDTLVPRSAHREMFAKAATSALTTLDVSALRGVSRAFVELLSRRTVLGRLAVRRVPPLTRMLPMSDGVTAGSVTEGQPIPVDVLTWDSETVLTPAKVAVITIFTQEVSQIDEGISVIERDLLRAMALGEDYALLDAAAAVGGGRPASILSGVSEVVDASAETIEQDVVALIEAVRGGEAESPAFIASASGALWLATRRAADGERLFPNVTVRGGDILGIPVLISPAATSRLVLVDAAVLLVADQGAQIEPAKQTSLQAVTDPALGPQNLISLFMTDTIGLRAVRFITWQMGLADGVGFIELPAGSPS